MKRLLLLSTLALCSPAFAQDAMFRGNPQHTGVYAGAGVLQFTKIKWQFHTRGQILSSPTVAGDALYVGGGDHSLYAIDPDCRYDEMEIQDRRQDHFLPRGFRWPRVLRQL